MNVNCGCVPEQTAPPFDNVPAGNGLTVTVVADEFASAQTPLRTTALNCVSCVKATEVCVDVVLAIVVHVKNGETDFSHLTTLPVFPIKVKTPEVDPEQIVVPPETEPPTVVGFTVKTPLTFVVPSQIPPPADV